MAVLVFASNPTELLNAIKSASREGKIAGWSVDSDGDFTYSLEQWRLKAWFRPAISEGSIVFRILTPQKTVMSSSTYAVYHARFVEMLLIHFDTQFNRALLTALPANGDQVKG